MRPHKRYHLNPRVLKQTAAQHTAFFTSYHREPNAHHSREVALDSQSLHRPAPANLCNQFKVCFVRCVLTAVLCKRALAAAVLRSAQLYACTAACRRKLTCFAFIYLGAVAALSVVNALH
jgi:hypothetical protein